MKSSGGSSNDGQEVMLIAKELWKKIQDEKDHGLEVFENIATDLADKVIVKYKSFVEVPADKAKTLRKVLTSASSTFRRNKRDSAKSGQIAEGKRWRELLLKTENLSRMLRVKNEQGHEFLSDPEEEEKDKEDSKVDCGSGLPMSTSVYLGRLQKQKKELYKSPPVMPPDRVVIESELCTTPPSRNKKTGELAFAAGRDESLETLLKDFRPNVTPEEVLRQGAFGGTYFRAIESAVTGKSYSGRQVVKDTLPASWIAGIDEELMLTSSTYRTTVNKFGVKCGGSLGMWESSGWISDADPYGWFQWYCRFYQGRRCSDDRRQILRWSKCAGPKGRFRSQLCNKILAANTNCSDASISPVIRQTLLHWGLTITQSVLNKHKARRK